MNVNSLFGATPPIVKNLIIVNVLMFMITLVKETFMISTFALFYPSSPYFKVIQIVSHIFMHADFFHIFFNMYILWMFGCTIERIWGRRKFLTYYMITGLGAAGLYLLSQWVRIEYVADTNLYQILASPCLGASGAVYGVLLAFGMMYPQAELQLILPPVRLKAIWLVVICCGIEIISGLRQSDGIAHFAHIGGMLFGFLIIQYWKYRGTLFRNDDY
ncbi:MAG: rhomboid family intramembrane serine protease [Prevotellaceae bacterium]|jgi:membrane associated rhomboid family serine protease|nr:rhomboid family intramembrane serine protease [Prevotellaceae bacterium]